jgi:hypothetical protein
MRFEQNVGVGLYLVETVKIFKSGQNVEYKGSNLLLLSHKTVFDNHVEGSQIQHDH